MADTQADGSGADDQDKILRPDGRAIDGVGTDREAGRAASCAEMWGNTITMPSRMAMRMRLMAQEYTEVAE